MFEGLNKKSLSMSNAMSRIQSDVIHSHAPGLTIEIPRMGNPMMNHGGQKTATLAPEKETREERLIRIRYEQILKREERDRKKKDKVQQKMEEVAKEPLVSVQISNQIQMLASIGGIKGMPLGIPNSFQQHQMAKLGVDLG